MKNLRYVFYLLLVAFTSSCSEWDSNGVDFRNYLRDKHPYSIVESIDLHGLFSYKVTDTLRNEIWVYTTYRSESSVKKELINCN